VDLAEWKFDLRVSVKRRLVRITFDPEGGVSTVTGSRHSERVHLLKVVLLVDDGLLAGAAQHLTRQRRALCLPRGVEARWEVVYLRMKRRQRSQMREGAIAKDAHLMPFACGQRYRPLLCIPLGVCSTDGWIWKTCGQTQMDGWTDAWMNGRTDRRQKADRQTKLISPRILKDRFRMITP
jgi:hypothetical protein